MTTPMTRDEIVELMARAVSSTECASANIVLDAQLATEEVQAIVQSILRALEAAGCQIVQGEPVAWMYDMPSDGSLIVHWERQEDRTNDGWTETPLYAGKVQP